MGKPEKAIETLVTRTISHFGGKAYKWQSPGNRGVPDRICFLPQGRIIAIEVKAPGKEPIGLQAKVIRNLRALGAEILVVSSKKEVDALYYQLKEDYRDVNK